MQDGLRHGQESRGGNNASFAYDAGGMRVRKTTSTGATRYPFANCEIGPDGALTSYTGQAMEVTVEVTYKTGGGSQRFSVLVRQDDGEWKIVEYSAVPSLDYPPAP